jgi:ribosomal protein L3
MKANKNPIYEIKECDKEFYHVLQVLVEHDEKNKQYNEVPRVVIYHKKDYEDFKKNKHVLGLKRDELIHIPQAEWEAANKKTEESGEKEVKHKTTKK